MPIRNATGHSALWGQKIERDAPLMMIDADADEDVAIAERLAPGTDFARLETKPQAEIVQISGRTLSDTWLLDP